ncbi:ABC transporter permease [Desulfosarcina sp. OttesenSCG-928-A07]|nr:ABC transporter permease [Desulfosarcina sp. OttesenSCG-928-A07]
MKPGTEIRQAEGQPLLFVQGDWTARHVDELGFLCADLFKSSKLVLVKGLDLREIGALDTTGAFLINKLRTARRTGTGVSRPDFLPLYNANPEQTALVELVTDPGDSGTKAENQRRSGHSTLLELPLVPVTRLGEAVCGLGSAAQERVTFLGEFMVAMGRNLIRPMDFRLTSMVYHMEQAGVNAIPIVCLLAFLIGTVLAYMTAGQLASFGAEIFVVKLLEVGVMREMGVLITAILVAGRSGSSYTAQIGSMLANQEVDAMRSMGIDPMTTLVIPRVLALIMMLPALVLLADLAGMLGGLCAVWLSLNITPQIFMETLRQGINFDNVLAGLIKAPFFALVIGGIGCFTGFKAGSSADSVGRMTTKAVVESIFLVITLDAVFAVFFSKIGF